MNKLLSGDKAFALGAYDAGAKVVSYSFTAAFEKGREEVSSADIG